MSLPVIYPTREDWLTAAVSELKPFFLINGVSISDKIRVSCALPSNAKRTNFKSVGECFPNTNSADAHYEIFISPVLADPVKVFETLIAMLCHTAKGALNHGKPYQKIADAMLLLPNGTQSARYKSVTHGGAFVQAYQQIIDSLGAYVHAELSVLVCCSLSAHHADIQFGSPPSGRLNMATSTCQSAPMRATPSL